MCNTVLVWWTGRFRERAIIGLLCGGNGSIENLAYEKAPFRSINGAKLLEYMEKRRATTAHSLNRAAPILVNFRQET